MYFLVFGISALKCISFHWIFRICLLFSLQIFLKNYGASAQYWKWILFKMILNRSPFFVFGLTDSELDFSGSAPKPGSAVYSQAGQCTAQ